MGHTSETLFEGFDTNNNSVLSNGARCDYGIDTNPALFYTYKDCVEAEFITRDELRFAVADGPALTALVQRNPFFAGVVVKTAWDALTHEPI